MTELQTNRFRFARAFLGISMLIMGGCGIIYEYTLGVLGNNLIGSSHEQIFVIIGIMMFAMGVGTVLQKQLVGSLLDKFLGLQLALGLVGGVSTLVIYTAYVEMATYLVVLYAFSFAIGVLIGLEIPVLIRINDEYSRSLRTNLAEILSMDYIGALIGALLFAYVLLSRVSVGRIGVTLGIVNTTVAFLGLLYFWPLVRRRHFLLGTSVTCLSLLGLAFFRVDGYMASLEQRCYRDPIVLRETSPYQHLVLTQRDERINFYINGHLQFSSRDEVIYHEMLVHPPMIQARSRSHVLILGGGDGLALREVLRYADVDSVTLVDIDPVVVKLFATVPELVELNRASFHDARVHTITASGVSPGEEVSVFRQTQLAARLIDDTNIELGKVRVFNIDADLFVREIGDEYDVVIIDFPDPSSLDLSKLYSVDFYRALAQHLAPGAVVSIQSSSPFYARAAFLAIGRTLEGAGYKTLPYHENVPSFGEWGWHLAWIGGESEAERLADLRGTSELPVDTAYLTPEIVGGAFSFGKDWLKSEESLRPNTKLFPVLASYYRRGWKD